jgi:hypothetical protein
MAGSSHWSLGGESDSSEGAVGPRFDVACRLRALPGRFASSYRTLVPARLDQQSGAVLLEAGGVVCTVEGNRVVPGATRMDLTGSALTIRPAAWAGEVPTTVRWEYVVSLVN